MNNGLSSPHRLKPNIELSQFYIPTWPTRAKSESTLISYLTSINNHQFSWQGKKYFWSSLRGSLLTLPLIVLQNSSFIDHSFPTVNQNRAGLNRLISKEKKNVNIVSRFTSFILFWAKVINRQWQTRSPMTTWKVSKLRKRRMFTQSKIALKVFCHYLYALISTCYSNSLTCISARLPVSRCKIVNCLNTVLC